MKKIIRLTEDDLTRIVRRVISEQGTPKPTGTSGSPKPTGTSGSPKPPQKPTVSQPTKLVGEDILLYSDSAQRKVFRKGVIKNVTKYSDGSVIIDLSVAGDVTNHRNPKIYFSCLKSEKLSYSYETNTSETKRVEVYCVPLLKALKNDYCMVGAGGILVPKVKFGANSSDTDVNIA